MPRQHGSYGAQASATAAEKFTVRGSFAGVLLKSLAQTAVVKSGLPCPLLTQSGHRWLYLARRANTGFIDEALVGSSILRAALPRGA